MESAPDPAGASASTRPSEPSPAPGGTYTSVAPVVATVITPLPTTLDPPPPTRRSTLKGVVFGATLGLAIVAAFVAGTRLAMRAQVASSASPPAAAGGPPAQGQQTPVAMAQQPAAPATQDAPPLVAATQLPVAPAAPKRGHRAWKPAPKTAADVEATPILMASSGPAVPAAPGAPAPSAAAAEPASDDSATSLIPVIPAATAAAPVDPFVKAVQTDIEEDTSKHR